MRINKTYEVRTAHNPANYLASASDLKSTTRLLQINQKSSNLYQLYDSMHLHTKHWLATRPDWTNAFLRLPPNSCCRVCFGTRFLSASRSDVNTRLLNQTNNPNANSTLVRRARNERTNERRDEQERIDKMFRRSEQRKDRLPCCVKRGWLRASAILRKMLRTRGPAQCAIKKLEVRVEPGVSCHPATSGGSPRWSWAAHLPLSGRRLGHDKSNDKSNWRRLIVNGEKHFENQNDLIR